MKGSLFDINRINELRELIHKYNDYYYNLANPLIGDEEYDKLFKELEDLENKYPEVISSFSPTQLVGAVIKTKSTYPHKTSMISLSNTYNSKDLYDWDKRVKKILGEERNKTIEYIFEPKIDGIGVSLTYKSGNLTRCLTRGDGISGEDITENIKTLPQVPQKIDIEKLGIKTLEIRGEVYMQNSLFEILNKDRIRNNELVFANPRNAAAGSLKLLDPEITRQRNLKIFLYSLGYVEYSDDSLFRFEKQIDFLNCIKNLGLPINPEIKLYNNIDLVVKNAISWVEKRDNLDYDIDGMVIKINSFKLQQILGETMHSPRWAVAYKFPAKEATTKVNDIKIQIGRTGILTPVAELEPIRLSGVVIKRATLHNFDELERLDIKIKDIVLIQRRGDVIPKIVKVIKEVRTGEEIKLIIPSKCPICNADIIKVDGEVAYKCPNRIGCTAQIEGAFKLFVSKKAMNIDGLGSNIIEQLINKNLVKNVFDIYKLTRENFLSLELVADKKAKKFLEQIEKSKSCDLKNLIYSFGIKHVGEKVSSLLAEKFESLEKLRDTDVETLKNISEIGGKIADSIKIFFDINPDLIAKLKDYGINTYRLENQTLKKNSLFYDKRFVITGTIEDISRIELISLIEKAGGSISESISKKIDFLIVGKTPGSKLQKALKFKNIKIIEEEEVKKIVNFLKEAYV